MKLLEREKKITQNRGYFLKRKSPLCRSARALHAMAPPNRRKKSCVRACAASVAARIGKPQKRLQKRLPKPKMRERDKLERENKRLKPEFEKRVSNPPCRLLVDFQPKVRKPTKPKVHPKEYGRRQSRSQTWDHYLIEKLEKKWRAVCYALMNVRSDGDIPRKLLTAIATECQVTPSTILNWKNRVLAGKSLRPNTKGRGPKTTVYNQASVGMRVIYEQWGGALSQLCFAELLEEENDLKVSKHTIGRILNNGSWKTVYQKIIPVNTEIHQTNRKIFCEQNLQNSFGGDESTDLWIDIDEKQFYQYSTKQIVYVPLECVKEVTKFIHATSKTMIPSVMFFGAIARPRPKDFFDGRVLLTPVCEEKEVKRRSKYNNAGDTKVVPRTMTVAIFKQYIKMKLIPAIRSLIKNRLSNIKTVHVQMDRAGGHGGGRQNIEKILAELNALGEKKKTTHSLCRTAIPIP